MTLANKPPGIRATDGSPRTGCELVATKIVEYIATANLKPGDRLPTERSFGEKLGVSRTVIREAVKMLSATGIVRAQQGSGLYVNNETQPFMMAAITMPMTVEPNDVASLFEFRMTVEVQTAQLAAERITPKELHKLQEAVQLSLRSAEMHHIEGFDESDDVFHFGIAEATGNPFLVSAVNATHSLQRWAVNIATGGAPGSYLTAAEEHAVIYNAISKGLPEEAGAAMRAHITTVINSYHQEVRRRLRSNGGFESPTQS